MDRFVPKESEAIEADYSDGYPFARKVHRDGLVQIPLHGETRIALCAKSGQGKTVIAENGISRALDDDYKLFHGSDVNNDINSISKHGGVSQEMADLLGLLPGEEPTEFPRRVMVPEFMFEKYRSDRIHWGERFTLGFRDITERDLKFLLGFDGWRSEAQQDLMDDVLTEINMDTVGFTSLFETIDRIAEKNSDDERTVRKVKRRLQALKDKKILSNTMRKDPFADFEDGSAVSLCLYHFDKVEERRYRFYSAIAHRNLVEKLRNGEITGRLILFEDEFHYLAPDGEESIVKDEFQKILNLTGRRANVSTIISTQQPSQLPYPGSDDEYDFFSPCNHYFLGRGLSWKDYHAVLKGTGLWHQGFVDRWKKRFSELKDKQFIYINDDVHETPEECPVVEAIAPLFHHGSYSERKPSSSPAEAPASI